MNRDGLVITNGCTGIPDFRFKDCCDAHDWSYVTHQMSDGAPCTREEADDMLRCCIRDKGAPLWAEIVYEGVRLLGEPYWQGYQMISTRGENPQTA